MTRNGLFANGLFGDSSNFAFISRVLFGFRLRDKDRLGPFGAHDNVVLLRIGERTSGKASCESNAARIREK